MSVTFSLQANEDAKEGKIAKYVMENIQKDYNKLQEEHNNFVESNSEKKRSSIFGPIWGGKSDQPP